MNGERGDGQTMKTERAEARARGAARRPAGAVAAAAAAAAALRAEQIILPLLLV